MASWGKCDFRQLKDLQKRMEKLQKVDYDDFCRDVTRELAARLLSKVIRRTPVGKTVSHEEDVTNDQGSSVVYRSGKRKGQLKRTKVVDHTGGTLRRGWTAKTEQEAKSGGSKNPADYARSLPVIKMGGTYIIEIINPVHYASYAEYGHRQLPGRYVPAIGKRLKAGWVKGRFMLTISEQELQAQAPAIIEKKFNKLLGECFNGK